MEKKQVVLKHKDGTVLYEGEAGIDENLVSIHSKDLDFIIDYAGINPRLTTRETLSMELDLGNPGKAVIDTPYGVLESEAGLIEWKPEKDRISLSYWIGDPESVQDFLLEVLDEENKE